MRSEPVMDEVRKAQFGVSWLAALEAKRGVVV